MSRLLQTDRPHETSPLRGVTGFAGRRPWTALITWLLLLVGVTVVAQGVGSAYGNGSDVSLPGTQSSQVAALLRVNAPAMTGDGVTVVVHDERGWNNDLDLRSLTRDLQRIDGVTAITSPSPARGTVSPDGTLGLLQVSLRGEQGAASKATYQRIVDVAQARATGQAQVELTGKGIRKLQHGGGNDAESAGVLAAMVILVLMFGSLLAASLPLITALLAVGTTLSVVALLSHVISVPDYTTPLLVLVGLGVGIDYSLLIFTRYRTELLSGADRVTAGQRALRTAGRSVLFAGACVIIALLGMFTLGIPAFEGTVSAVAITVLVTLVGSLTLLPALLSIFGARIERRVRGRAARTSRAAGDGWRRWAQLVQRRPWPALVVAVLALMVLAIPAFGMQLGFNDAGNDPTGSTTRAAYNLISDKLGPGANGPLLVVTDGSGAAQAAQVHDMVARNPGIVPGSVSAPIPLGQDHFQLRAQPTTAPQDAATGDLVRQLRHTLADRAKVGGMTAANVDYSDAIARRLPLFVLVVVGVSAVLLLWVFRSLAIAVKAAVLNLLSIGAALGAMKLVYQDGHLWGSAGPIEAFMPVFIFAIVFGLSMDYEVFLLSRMREVWLQTRDPQRAVTEGLAHTGGVVTAAAAIMCVVFGSLALLPDRMMQQTGFAMAVAVLLDAVVIRCLIVPALMRLLGAKAWWLPEGLNRLLPR